MVHTTKGYKIKNLKNSILNLQSKFLMTYNIESEYYILCMNFQTNINL